MRATSRRTNLSLLLLLSLALATVSVSAGGAPAQLQASPAGDSAPAADGGSISAPSGGSDAKSILADHAQMMGHSSDSANGDDDAHSDPGHKRDDKNNQVQHGQCVIGCASQSTDGVGCGNDLSKPDCFCKSESFIDQTFACVNATCQQQFHGAAGVITSLCAGVGVTNLTIPGYNSSSNLENMPTISDGGSTNKTNSMILPPGTPSEGGKTSTFSMPAGMQTNIPSSGSSSGASAGSGGQSGSSNASSASGSTSGSAKGQVEKAMVAMVAGAVTLASVGIWTLF